MPRQHGRVLAVDDSPVMRVLVAAALEALGYSVESVDSGAAALEAFRFQTFDAVILDVDMPGLDGLAVGRALRRDPKTRASMIAMHTSLDESFVRQGFDSYDAFLPKPCNTRLLGQRIDEMIRDRRQRGAASTAPTPDFGPLERLGHAPSASNAAAHQTPYLSKTTASSNSAAISAAS